MHVCRGEGRGQRQGRSRSGRWANHERRMKNRAVGHGSALRHVNEPPEAGPVPAATAAKHLRPRLPRPASLKPRAAGPPADRAGAGESPSPIASRRTLVLGRRAKGNLRAADTLVQPAIMLRRRFSRYPRPAPRAPACSASWRHVLAGAKEQVPAASLSGVGAALHLTAEGRPAAGVPRPQLRARGPLRAKRRQGRAGAAISRAPEPAHRRGGTYLRTSAPRGGPANQLMP